MELGCDSDTGGQVKFVVELAKALLMIPGGYRVDLFTNRLKVRMMNHGGGAIELNDNYNVCIKDVSIAGVQMLDVNSTDKAEPIQYSQAVRRNVTEGYDPNLMRLEEVVQKHDEVPAEVFSTPTHLAIVMEYASGGELFEIICNAGRFSEDEARFFFQQLISGVSYCRFMQICHRDLKLENTLLDSSSVPRLKICDFGYFQSSVFHSLPKSTVGTLAYIAPEVLCRKVYDGKIADVWSCGGWTIEWQGLSGNNLTIGTTLLEAIKATIDPSTEVIFPENRDAYFIQDDDFFYAIVAIGILTPYLNGFVSKMLVFLQIGKQMVQGAALTALVSLADSSREQFQNYYDAVMPYLKVIVPNATEKRAWDLSTGMEENFLSTVLVAWAHLNELMDMPKDANF